MSAVTITKVADDVRNFTTANGSFGAFRVLLEDGRIGEVTAKADNVAKRQEQFRGFIGTPTDLIVEDAGKWDDGNPKPLRVKLPQQQQGGGKRDYTPRFTDTEAGWRESDERVDRRRALELAQAEGVGITTDLATKFYNWLRETAADRPEGTKERGFVAADQVASATSYTLAPSSETPGAGTSPSLAPVEKGRVGADGEASPALPNTSSGVSTATAPESEGVRGDDAPSDNLLDQLYTKYGSGPKVLKAARAFYTDDPPSALADLTEGQMKMLLLEVAHA